MAKRAKQQDIFYRTIPALAAYIDRIGAEQLNFRRFMVKEYAGHYYTERAIIKIEADGTVVCPKKDYAPTAEEAEAIKLAMASQQLPTAIGAQNTDQLKQFLSAGSTLYEFIRRKDSTIIFVQERVPMKDGKKAYKPWTFFSDGKWRNMEPDGELPFWMPKQTRNKSKLMVHEGAKAAQHVDGLVNDPARKEELAAHPWGEELKEYEHWGIIGGALAPHRAAYHQLREEKPDAMVYVCDRDPPGEAMLAVVAKQWNGHLKGIMFGEKFPYSFDMADELPANLYVGTRYVGPSLAALLKPATYATETIPNPAGTGRPINKLRISFRDEWYHSVTPEAFVHRDWPDRLLSMQEFNNLVAPFSEVDETARLLKKEDSSKALALKYDPSLKDGVYGSEQSGRFINTHVPSSIRAEKGDAGPFIEFMTHLIPDESDRRELMRWVATLIARPDIKMLYGVLLISEAQGIGKSTLGEKILAPLMGENNVSYPSETEIVDSTFNYWLSHKRLAVVHEIYAGHSAKGYLRLKTVITDRVIVVSKKYAANYNIENWIHVFACSNSLRALQISGDDRRWLVPHVTEEKKPSAWWGRLNAWLREEGGLEIIKWWAGEFLKKVAPVVPGEDAPMTKVKQDVIEEGMSPGQLLVANTLDRIKAEANGKAPIVIDLDLVTLIKDVLYEGKHADRLEKTSTLRRLAKDRGWWPSEAKFTMRAWGAGTNVRFLTTDKELAKQLPSKLAEEGYKPVDVSAFHGRNGGI